MNRGVKIILSFAGIIAFQRAFAIYKYVDNVEISIIINIILFLIFILLLDDKKEKTIQIERKYVFDSNIIMDGRIFKLFENKIFDGVIIILNCVFNELQLLSESSDILKKNRSKNAFQKINKLKEQGQLKLKIIDNTNQKNFNLPTDQQIIEYCKNNTDVFLITNDNGLHEAALAKNIKSINFKKDIIDICKINININDIILVDLIKKGKDQGQAIGYTNTNLMVVVNNGEEYIGNRMKVKVINVVETVSGDLAFANIFLGKSSEE